MHANAPILGGMRRAAWKRRLSQPSTRLTAVAWVVVTLVVAQFVLLIAGGRAADREAGHALGTSFEYLTDISQERVVLSASAVEQLVVGTSVLLRADPSLRGDLLGTLKAELVDVNEAESLSVTYANGDYLKLRRSDTQPDGFEGYSVVYGDGTVATRRVTEYDADLNVVSSRITTVVFGATSSPSYRAASSAMEPVWTGPALDPATGVHVERLSLATRDGSGNVTMVVAANLSISQLQESLATVPSGSDGQISVLTGDRVVIMTPGVGAEGGATRDFGTGANAIDVGVVTTAPATISDDDVVGTDGRYTTLERGLASEGLDWVVHVRVSASGLNDGFGRLKATLNVVIGGLAVLTIVLGYVLAMLWRPLRALRVGAEHDALTGLHNRRHLDAASQPMLRFAQRTGARVAFVMCDLDNFKSINDDLGHGDGDRALAAVGRRLAQEIRAGDLAVRWGGDEFLMVLLLPPGDGAGVVVERIRSGAAEALAGLFPDRPALGVTAGFSVTDGADNDVRELIAAADHALVRGKSLGKGHSYPFTAMSAE